jgi:hypothetical protein
MIFPDRRLIVTGQLSPAIAGCITITSVTVECRLRFGLHHALAN